MLGAPTSRTEQPNIYGLANDERSAPFGQNETSALVETEQLLLLSWHCLPQCSTADGLLSVSRLLTPQHGGGTCYALNELLQNADDE